MNETIPARFSKIPELLSFVYRFATPNTRRSLLQVSRSFFNIGVPIVWESVEGAHNILRLIPEAIITISSNGFSGYTTQNRIKITLPPDLDFNRFDLYARHIQKLEIYTPSSTVPYSQIVPTNWTLLSAYSKRHTLLPNLSQLTLTTHFRGSDEGELLIWIRTFMCPSLTTLRVTDETYIYHPMTIPVANTIVRYAVSNCPNLRVLSLVSSEQLERPTSTHLPAALTFWEPSYYQCLPSLPLRELCCDMGILSPSNVHVLGQLPYLERLELRCERELSDWNITQPKSEWLPLLNEFSLITPHWPDVATILEMSVCSRVKSLSICLTDPKYEEVEVLTDTLAMGLMDLIARCAPTLTEFHIDFGEYLFFAPDDPSVFQALSGLSLHTLSLINVTMLPGMLERFLSYFPLASTIKIPDYELDLDSLSYFSWRPELVHLSVSLGLLLFSGGMPQLGSTFQVAPNFQTLEVTSSLNSMRIDLSLLARHLLSIWPNLKHVTWTACSSDEDHDRDVMVSNGLNALISAYRRISALGG